MSWCPARLPDRTSQSYDLPYNSSCARRGHALKTRRLGQGCGGRVSFMPPPPDPSRSLPSQKRNIRLSATRISEPALLSVPSRGHTRALASSPLTKAISAQLEGSPSCAVPRKGQRPVRRRACGPRTARWGSSLWRAFPGEVSCGLESQGPSLGPRRRPGERCFLGKWRLEGVLACSVVLCRDQRGLLAQF